MRKMPRCGELLDRPDLIRRAAERDRDGAGAWSPAAARSGRARPLGSEADRSGIASSIRWRVEFAIELGESPAPVEVRKRQRPTLPAAPGLDESLPRLG